MLFSTPKAQRVASQASEAESPSADWSDSSVQLIISKPSGWRSAISRLPAPADERQMLLAELQACYRLLKEERRVNNDFHRRVHGVPSEWGKSVSKRIMERHPLYSPGKEKRQRQESPALVELDDIEEMIREEVLEALLGRQELCSCGKPVETGEMFTSHVLPCPHCRKQKCSDCTEAALEVRDKSSCCEACAMACISCVRRLRLACSQCQHGRRCHGAGCGGIRCSTCFNQLCEDCKELDHGEHGDLAVLAEDRDDDDEPAEGTGFEFFYCPHCQFRSCQDCHRKNCYCAPATRHRAPGAIPSRVEGRSMSYLFKKLGGEGKK